MKLTVPVFLTILITVLLQASVQANAQTEQPEEETSKTSTSGERQELEEDKRNELWKALDLPEHLKQEYPYYFAGRDTRNQPVWIVEWGKWDVKKIFDGGVEKMKMFDSYVDQMFHEIQSSISSVSNGKNIVSRWVTIVDMKDYDLSQLASLQSLVYLFKFTGQWEEATRNLDYGFIINTTTETQTLLNGLRSILGESMDRVEIYGSNPATWIKRVQRKIPKQILPISYGGFKNFLPVSNLH